MPCRPRFEKVVLAWGYPVADYLASGIAPSFSGILTGVILAVSRAIGETAPLIAMGALTFVPFAPDGLLSPFSALPIQIFNWTSRPQAEFQQAAAAGIIVLLIVLLIMNAGAVILRNKFQKPSEG